MKAMELKIYWSDCLEKLAEALFRDAAVREDPFEAECTVVGSPVMEGWLKQYFLHDLPRGMKKNQVLAGWDFRMLHPFVNDWLAKACAGTAVGERDPARHPYSSGVLQWRIWNELSRKDAPGAYDTLHAYVGGDECDPGAMDRKRWGLAARLARLFDDYQNYRADLLEDWGAGGSKGLSDSLLWQAVLWRNLVEDRPETYLGQFRDMRGKLANCGIRQAYRRVTVFHTSAMPRAYMEFFVELGRVMDVRMYIFNPSQEFWIEDRDVRSHLRNLAMNGESLAWLTPPHPVLSGFGRGTQALLATVLDVTEGEVSEAEWSGAKADTLLHKMQADIRKKGDPGIRDARDDGSIQFHICHGPQREVEVARDLIWKWFEEHPGSQPRDVQVLVPDMDTYAPFLESVFRISDRNPPVPCSISRRPAVSAGSTGAAFVRLMNFNGSRMTAPEVMELLELDPVRERYGLTPDELATLRGLVNKAGIRWGRDGDHLKGVLGGEDYPDTVTWRRGLDRLLAGFAVGRCDGGDDVIDAGALGALCVYDGVEGDIAELVGTLGRFHRDLCDTVDGIQEKARRRVSEWADFHMGMLERFFLGTESSFVELAEIRRGIAAVRSSAEVAGDPEVGANVVAAAIEAHLGGMEPAGRSDVNAVLFSPMRTMQVTPRKLLIMLGLNEGVFPRADQRPAFDMLAIRPRFGDRSLRYEDRLAFLEGLLSARDRLIITCNGRNLSNNKEIPPSPAVTEFLQYLDSFSGDAGGDGRGKPLVVPFEHRLHGANPDYYRKGSRLFSYSRSNYAAACRLAGQWPTPGTAVDGGTVQASARELPADGGPAAGRTGLTVEDLQEFFVNPARFFYTTVLQVRLPDPARDEVSDSEIFEGDELDEYEINRILLEDLLGQSASRAKADFEPGPAYYRRFQEQALIPLGAFGRRRTGQRLAGLRRFLNSTMCGDERNLYQWLRDRREKENDRTPVAVEWEGYIVSGNLPLLPFRGGSLLLGFRYALIKPKDLVRAWVAHVAGHAAGLRFETVIVGKDGEQPSFGPLDTAAAREILAVMLDRYGAGNRQRLPFAPACSRAYAQSRIRREPEEMALEAAGNAWGSRQDRESSDGYLLEAWGGEGPVHESDFGRCAMDFWGKCPALSPANPAAGDAAGGEDRHV